MHSNKTMRGGETALQNGGTYREELPGIKDTINLEFLEIWASTT